MGYTTARVGRYLISNFNTHEDHSNLLPNRTPTLPMSDTPTDGSIYPNAPTPKQEA